MIRPPVALRETLEKLRRLRRPEPPPAAKPAPLPRCSRCRKPVTWENIQAIENSMTVYVQEKLYYCPHCGAILGVASWHSIG